MPEPTVTIRSRLNKFFGQGRAFRLLLAGSSVSMLGTRVTTIAFPMLVLYLTGSPAMAGWAAFAATVPSVLAYMPAGALVDRWQPRRVMLVSEFGRGVAIATIVIALALGRPSIPLLICVIVAEGILEVFSTLAERRYVRTLVRREKTSSALVSMEARTHAVVLTGRPLGGLLFALAPILPFIANVASFAVSFGSILAIKSRQPIRRPSFPRRDFFARLARGDVCRGSRGQSAANCAGVISHRQLWNEVNEGVRWLRRDRFIRVAMELSAGTTLICQALIIVFLAGARTRHLSSIEIGLALAASGAGGALGSMVASRMPAPGRPSWTLIRVCVWSGAALVLIASPAWSFVFMAVVMAMLGFSGALNNVEIGTYLIQNVAEGMLARVTSIGRLLSFGAVAVGPVVGGAVFQVWGFRAAVSVLSVMLTVMAILAFRMPPMRMSATVQPGRPEARRAPEGRTPAGGTAGPRNAAGRGALPDIRTDLAGHRLG